MMRKRPEALLQPPPREERVAALRVELHRRYGIPPDEAVVVNSPYRICPLGAHVDHQDGVVTGMAIDQSVLLAFAPAKDRSVRMCSLNFPHEVMFTLDAIPAKLAKDWGNYLRGAALALQQNHKLRRGLVGVVEGDMPIGGLSSSAAVGVAYLLALEKVNGLKLGLRERIHLDRFIENVYVGVHNGILDQSVILASKARHLLRLDCRDETMSTIHSPAATDSRFQIAVVYSGVTESLTRTDYNQRVAECQEAAGQLLRFAGVFPKGEVRLRQVSETIFEQHGSSLPARLYRRANHFFTEQQRVSAGVIAWREGDLRAFGHLINESGRSSIENYECGCPELITLYELLRDCDGVYGARFSGAGFRGCCVALVERSKTRKVFERIASEYPRRHPRYASAFRVAFCDSDDGARLLRS